MANTVPSGGGSETGVFRFNRQGIGQDSFGVISPGSNFSIATNGNEFFVGSTGEGIRRYSRSGDFLGNFGPRSLGVPRLEFDAAGSLYGTPGNAGAVRYNSDGTTAQAFQPIRFTSGIDADAMGNVYVRGETGGGGEGVVRDGLFKYSAAGALLGFTATPRAAGDLSIDEANGILYLYTGGNLALSVSAYDITGSAPVFLRSIPTPGLIEGISFDASTGHLLGAELIPGRGWEITTDGVVVQQYEFGGAYFAFDIVATPVPEPATAVLLLTLAAVGWGVRRRGG